MTQQHPINPPPELVHQWQEEPAFSALSPCAMVSITNTKLKDIATRAAQWGADMELEACIDWIAVYQGLEHPELLIELLRAARRPKPPSLKELALEDLEILVADLANHGMGFKATNIRRALEQLPDYTSEEH